MSKIRYDVSGATAGGDWEHAPVGLYLMEVKEINQKDSKAKNPMLEVVMRPVATADGEKLESEYNNVWYYILIDGSQDARLRGLTDALGLPAKGSLDTDAAAGSIVLAQLKADKDQDGDYRPRVAKLLPAPDDASVADEEGEEDEEDDEEGIDLAELNRTQLKALIKENSLEIRVLKSTTDDQLREAIAEALGGEDETEEPEEDEEEEEPEEDEEEGIDLSTLDRNELKKLIKDNELEIRVLKSMSDDDIRAAIAEALGGAEGGDDEEEEDDEEGSNYESMQIADLKALLKERGLSTSGAKQTLISRLKEDDGSKGGDPF